MKDIDIENTHILIGKNVAKYRKQKGISQLDLSLRLGHKSVSIIASAERFYRKQHFNIEHLVKIANILDVHICNFFDED